MFRRQHLPRFLAVLGTIVASVVWSANAADPPRRSAPEQGEVSAESVYVRSGPSLNHYTICKLNAGDRVTIVGERNGWYEILAPAGVFSLISGDYVDSPDGKSGVVNGSNVRVRAGSSLNDSKYTIQTKLSKGAEVSILGRNPDGFYRIVPPDDVTVWISADFVERVSPGRLQHVRAVQAPIGDVTPAPTGAGVTDEKVSPEDAEPHSGSLLAAVQATFERGQLAEIDADADAEFAKPLLDRELDSLIKRYRKVAGQEEDEFARRYAEARITQIENMVEAAEAIRRVRRMGEQTDARRREFMAERANMHSAPVPVPSGLSAQGELHVSALYVPGTQPNRYRLVDPTQSPPRTIAYVDIPAELVIDVNEFLGRYVGVRASGQRLQPGGVDPVPIYVARELVVLDPAVATAGAEGD